MLFSLPLWPGLQPQELQEIVIPKLIASRDIITDLYITCRTPPFVSDAMGGVLVGADSEVAYQNALYVSNVTGIPLSATFNNTTINPSYENYLVFVNNFRRLYEDGISIITIPNTAWLLFGLKDKFPGLFVKNTVLNVARSESEIARLFESGFDYINLDRTLMRDAEQLVNIFEVKRVMSRKLGRNLYTSLLYNEMCEADCPIHKDHYTYNFNRTEHTLAFFHSKMATIAPCAKNGQNVDYILKAAGIPSYYSMLNHLEQFVDVFKLHGRESRNVFYESLNIVERYAKAEYVEDEYRKILSCVSGKTRAQYLKKIQTCKFNCWKCDYCSVVAKEYQETTGSSTLKSY